MLSEDYLIEQLNAPTKQERLMAITGLKKLMDDGFLEKPARAEDINNHIHTTYSFSPYSPSKAVWRAYTAGLCTAGIMDHDSVGGAEEFIEAGKIVDLPITVGMEMRVDFSKTPLNGRRINNPDQDSIAYMAIHGIPHTQLKRAAEFMQESRNKRNIRNVKMVEGINTRFSNDGLELDFEMDVRPLSMSHLGGSITERHLLFALAKKMCERFGRGQAVIDYLTDTMGIEVSEKLRGYLLDIANPFYEYDLLGALKSDLSSIYIDADEECIDVRDAVAFADSIGAISAYAYLGDVGHSVTGDKRAQAFEDSYLDQIFEVISELGFKAVTYMPSRNTPQQLERLRALCEQYSLFQISGEDINSPRQLFICKALQNPAYHNLVDSAWALIGHEQAATKDIELGMFSQSSIKKYGSLDERIKFFGKLGRNPELIENH